MKDLLIVVADGYQEKVIESLMPRMPLSSGTRQFTYDIIKNPGKDPGSLNDSHELLRPFIRQYNYSLVIFDFEGSGTDKATRVEVEGVVEKLLSSNGWDDRCAVVVIEPELENWIWIDNPNVEQAIGWEKDESLYSWARRNEYLGEEATKPVRPKETLEEALKISDTPTSASIYKKIAATVSYRACTDPAFIKLIQQLQAWFPQVVI